MRLLVTWLINALALLALPYLMHSVSIDSFGTAMVVALVLGFVNTIIRPILVILTLPVTVMTMGLFIFIINGVMFWAVANTPWLAAASGWSCARVCVGARSPRHPPSRFRLGRSKTHRHTRSGHRQRCLSHRRRPPHLAIPRSRRRRPCHPRRT